MRSCKVLLMYLITTGLYLFCEGLNKGDPGVCEELIPKIYTRTIKVRCARGFCTKQVSRKSHITSFTCCTNWEYNVDKQKCQPTCNPSCVNGHCAEPGVCACDGSLVPHNSTTCRLPICDPPCFRGTCVADNVCRCNSDLVSNNNTHCGPTCKPGFHLDNNTLECVPTCNDGFTLSDDRTNCVFECNPICVNGICVGPNLCSCLPGYIGDIESRCKPVCKNCEHGKCVAPDTCLCNEGYIQVDGKCTTRCSEDCINGVCTDPEICTCNPGYKFNASQNCIPICEPDCLHGVCSSPNECSCNEGYTQNNNSNCSPKCDDCKNGECVEPNVCRCYEGYVSNNGSCIPVCKQSCINGYCSEPDVCLCESGYKTTEDSNYVCEPLCDMPCVNGTCVSPNTCTCLSGFKRTNSSHECEPQCESCYNGDCVAPEVCICHIGYYLDQGRCLPKCLEPCINGYCHLPNQCECENGYVPDRRNPYICSRVCEDGRRCIDEGCCEIESVLCSTCEGSCVEGICACVDINIPCYMSGSDLQVSNTSLAGIQLTWILAAAFGLLLVIALVVVTFRMHRKRRDYETKTPEAQSFEDICFKIELQNSTRTKDIHTLQVK